jgi:hypothetical protein
MQYLKMSPMKPDTLPGCMAEIFFSSFFGGGSRFKIMYCLEVVNLLYIESWTVLA